MINANCDVIHANGDVVQASGDVIHVNGDVIYRSINQSIKALFRNEHYIEHQNILTAIHDKD